jgi:hypothetical protein
MAEEWGELNINWHLEAFLHAVLGCLWFKLNVVRTLVKTVFCLSRANLFITQKISPCNNTRSPLLRFRALCIVVIVVSLIKIAASNENIECFREYFAVGYRAPDPSFFEKFLHGSGQKISRSVYPA